MNNSSNGSSSNEIAPHSICIERFKNFCKDDRGIVIIFTNSYVAYCAVDNKINEIEKRTDFPHDIIILPDLFMFN